MKKNVALSSLAIALIYILFSSYSNGVAFVNNSDRTGSPLSSGTCGNCHTGGSFGTTINMVVKDDANNPVTSYIGGETYFLEFTVSSTSGNPEYGFQAVAMTSSNSNAGNMDSVLTADTRIETLSTRKYAEQSSRSSTGFFKVRWIAPAANTGNVTFYYIGNAVNVNFSTSGDQSTAGLSTVLTEQLVFTATGSTVSNVSCNGFNDGIGVVSVANGSSNYSYLWSNGSVTNSTTNTTDTLYNLAPGIYTVTATDGTSAVDTATIIITEPTPMVTTTSSVDASCAGGLGDVHSTTTGGTPPYSYSWSSGAIISSHFAIPAGTYTITVTDANGCTTVNSETIAQGAPIQVSATLTHPLCDNLNDGTINLTVSGTTGNVSYLWSTGDTTSTISNLAPGLYLVTVTNSSNCTTDTSFVINTGNTAPVIQLTDTLEACDSVLVEAPAGFMTYNWSSGASTASFTTTSSGTYLLTITDNNGCTGSDSTRVIVNEPPRFKLWNDTVICDTSLATFPLIAPDKFDILWSTGDTSSTIIPADTGFFSATVTDENGCSAMDTIRIDTITCKSTVGLSELELNESISIYPNPFHHSIQLDISKPIESITIYDLKGRLIREKVKLNLDNTISLEELNKGTYLIILQTADQTFTKKILKM